MCNIEYLTNFRKSKGYNKLEFAKLIDCPDSTYHYVEKGRTPLSVKSLVALIKTFDDFDLFEYLETINADREENVFLKNCLDACEEENRDLRLEIKKRDEEIELYKNKLNDLKDTALELLLAERNKDGKKA